MTSHSSASDGMASSFFQALQAVVKGELYSDPVTRRVYSVDASIYEVEPLAVCIPKSVSELKEIAAVAKAYNVPLIARGAATGLTGGCLGEGLIVDTSKYLTSIIEINPKERYVRCEPGITQEALNHALKEYGYRLGPDTSTGNRATLGGMLANNAAGEHSLIFGAMADAVQAVTLLLSGGELLSFKELSEEQWQQQCEKEGRIGAIYRTIKKIKEECSEEIKKRFPPLPRRVSGYNLDRLIEKKGLNLSKLIAGSEGSLGIVTEMTLLIEPLYETASLSLLFFDDLVQAMERVEEILTFSPVALEMIDDKIITRGREAPYLKGKLDWLKETPRALFIVEFQKNTQYEAQQKRFKEMVKRLNIQSLHTEERAIIDSVFALRKAGLGLLLSKRSYSRAIAFIEDLSVAPKQLASFIQQFEKCLSSHGKESGIYGHVGSGCMHIRPFIDLREEKELALIKTLMVEVTEIVLAHGGALSGEHGDGFARSWLNKTLYGEKIYQAMEAIKHAFDPDGLMNPHTVVDGLPPDENLRIDPTTEIQEIATFQDFSKEGGFALSLDLCNGNGQCRKMTTVMCPSYQATKEEYSTTRARAQALRAIINGKAPKESLTSDAIHDILDLCLECKGCKSECPSQVDMAKIKSEVLYQRHQKRGAPLRSRLFGHIRTLYRLLSFFPSVTPNKMILRWLGITDKRSFPPLAKEPFSKYWKKKAQTTHHHKPLVLFVDTFTEYNSPSIAISASRILEGLGYDITVVTKGCCGRPLVSKGLLKEARKSASSLIETLAPFAEKHIPIIGLEPSCLYTIKDDFFSLVDSAALKKAALSISEVIEPFESFLLKQGPLPLTFPSTDLLVHGHCHQKSREPQDQTVQLLNSIANLNAKAIPSGCCGMAGSFGFESEHYPLSMKIGELVLFPALRKAKKASVIIANGTSCRKQIKDGTGKEAYHLAEFLYKGIRS